MIDEKYKLIIFLFILSIITFFLLIKLYNKNQCNKNIISMNQDTTSSISQSSILKESAIVKQSDSDREAILKRANIV